ncbi:hypothetical protein J6590_002507 [Homalodisca vitripennis]|nr:hypothetical protein J6590_002507 [Homalodisca vitripennis]
MCCEYKSSRKATTSRDNQKWYDNHHVVFSGVFTYSSISCQRKVRKRLRGNFPVTAARRRLSRLVQHTTAELGKATKLLSGAGCEIQQLLPHPDEGYTEFLWNVEQMYACKFKARRQQLLSHPDEGYTEFLWNVEQRVDFFYEHKSVSGGGGELLINSVCPADKINFSGPTRVTILGCVRNGLNRQLKWILLPVSDWRVRHDTI